MSERLKGLPRALYTGVREDKGLPRALITRVYASLLASQDPINPGICLPTSLSGPPNTRVYASLLASQDPNTRVYASLYASQDPNTRVYASLVYVRRGHTQGRRPRGRLAPTEASQPPFPFHCWPVLDHCVRLCPFWSLFSLLS